MTVFQFSAATLSSMGHNVITQSHALIRPTDAETTNVPASLLRTSKATISGARDSRFTAGSSWTLCDSSLLLARYMSNRMSEIFVN